MEKGHVEREAVKKRRVKGGRQGARIRDTEQEQREEKAEN